MGTRREGLPEGDVYFVIRKDYRLCASVDNTAQAWRMMDKLCKDFHDGHYFIRANALLLIDAELTQIGQQIENEYQRIKPLRQS